MKILFYLLSFCFIINTNTLSAQKFTGKDFFSGNNEQFIMPQNIKNDYINFLKNEYIIPFLAHPAGNGEISLPPEMFFYNKNEYDNFWKTAKLIDTELDIVERKYQLQPKVATQLKKAIKELKEKGITFKVRGSIGVFRSWDSAVSTWNKRIAKELSHHRKNISANDELSKKLLDAVENLGKQEKYIEQAALINWLETKHTTKIMFGKLHKGPLFSSCASPGTSHHSLGIAIDVDISTLRHNSSLTIFAKHGFFRCIVGDFAHFVYLGEQYQNKELLKQQNIKWIKHTDGSMYMKCEPQ